MWALRFRQIAFLICALICSAANAFAEDWAVVGASALTVYDMPGGAPIGTASAGDNVNVIEYSGQWARLSFVVNKVNVISGGGWVQSSGLRIIERRSYTGIKSCETEARSGAQICAIVSMSAITCEEDYETDFYEGCTGEVSCLIESEYKGSTGIDVDVTCTIRIKYKVQGSSAWSTEELEAHDSLRVVAGSRASARFEVRFDFSPYDKVVVAKLETATCKISGLELQ